MTLRTPRRRIAPRTRRRYRAIKDFLKRALGTTSDPDIKTNSTVATTEISVTDLKHKIVGIEDKLDKVSKHCRDLAYLENNFKQEAENLVIKLKRDPNCEHQDNSLIDFKTADTKVLYRTSDSRYKRLNESDHKIKTDYHGIGKSMTTANLSRQYEKIPRSKTKYSHREQPILWMKHHRGDELHYGTFAEQSTSSFHSLYHVGDHQRPKPGCSKHERRHSKREYIEPLFQKETKDKYKIKREIELTNKKAEVPHLRNHRKKRGHADLDQEFINNIIQKQYKPVLFGRRESDYSQFSAPVCRDYEFRIKRDEVQKGSDLCSCCFEQCKRHRYNHLHNSDLSDMRSVCDARLYSSKKRNCYCCKREHLNDYNNSEYYDIYPVKEKSSPKSRRKFVEDHVKAYQYYKEVPPSPRTQRPRLNLKAKPYEEYDNNNYNYRKNHLSRSKSKYETDVENEGLSENPQIDQTTQIQKTQTSRIRKPLNSHEDVGTMSILEYPNIVNENNQSNYDTTLNTQTTEVSDKTDKTLCEIKDILQSFLSELKKESLHSDNTNQTSKLDNNQLNGNEKNKLHFNSNEKSGCSFNNCGAGSCNVPPYLPPFPNPCCYPILPMCPMNCMQNGYIVPSPSYTCMVCAKSSKDPEKISSNHKSKITENVNPNQETQELIREIYKFVTQSPKIDNHAADHLLRNQQNKAEKKLLTTTSVGGHSKVSKHDARVGTPAMKCVSKSCEALGSRQYSDTFYTNASYSDTILEKLSVEPTQSSSESDISNASLKKIKKNKFKKILRTIGLWKKKKRDVIEEMSESESIVNTKPRLPPFRQNIINYNMHGQDFFHPPPIPEHIYHTSHSPETPQKCYCPSGLDGRLCPNVMCNQPTYGPHHAPHRLRHNPIHPNCYPHYNEMQPQVPLCLKEIEVKSIGTQSVKGNKDSLFSKFTKKLQPQQQIEIQPQNTPLPEKEKPALFNWKNFQEKIKQGTPDALDFTMKTQKQLAQGDMKIRNAMIKKLFYKRNPFSPRNLIVKTLLGKDPSSYGNPPKMYRPRMFL